MPSRRYAADYKALVCIFQYGGSDGMNMVVPSDATRHGQYAGVRGALALPRGGLASLTGSDYGLHPAMASLLPFWNQSQLAPVFNLGPLHQPLTKAQYLAAGGTGATVPASLFSHSDQQRQWESAVSDSLSRTGWGGRASNALATINPTISVGGNGLFGVEDLRSPLVLPGPGSGFGAYGLMPQDQDWEPNRLRKAAVDALYAEPQGNAIADSLRRPAARGLRDEQPAVGHRRLAAGRRHVGGGDRRCVRPADHRRLHLHLAGPADVPAGQADRLQRHGAGQPADLLCHPWRL
jgi:uncharacterized protein (DUF1501 family)